MTNAADSAKPSGLALVPFAVFAAFYVGLSLYADHLGFEMPWYKVSMPVAFVVASAVSLIIGRRRTLDEKVEVYARGMGEPNIMIMCLIFILAGAFATIAKGSGADGVLGPPLEVPDSYGGLALRRRAVAAYRVAESRALARERDAGAQDEPHADRLVQRERNRDDVRGVHPAVRP